MQPCARGCQAKGITGCCPPLEMSAWLGFLGIQKNVGGGLRSGGERQRAGTKLSSGLRKAGGQGVFICVLQPSRSGKRHIRGVPPVNVSSTTAFEKRVELDLSVGGFAGSMLDAAKRLSRSTTALKDCLSCTIKSGIVDSTTTVLNFWPASSVTNYWFGTTFRQGRRDCRIKTLLVVRRCLVYW